MMQKVTKLNESHQHLINDDDNKPYRYKIKRENLGDRRFIDWSLAVDYQSTLLNECIDWIISESGIKLQKRTVDRFRHLAGVVLLNLGGCLIQTSWLQLPKKKEK